MLLRQTGQDGVSGKSVIAQPAWRQWRQASRRHISPASMGSRHTQQTSSRDVGPPSTSRNITVTSLTANSASFRRETERCTPPTSFFSNEPKKTSSSSFTRGFTSPRGSPTPGGAQTSMRAVVACKRCQTSAKSGGWTQGNGWMLCIRSRQLPSEMAFSRPAWIPKTSETRSILRKTLGERRQDDQRRAGNSRAPSTSAKGVVMVTGNSTQAVFRSLSRAASTSTPIWAGECCPVQPSASAACTSSQAPLAEPCKAAAG
mmetsp:Transcript_12003/g.26862  ORF Transcript_12003/g.26862 Transcript_12003/m.26862 type:complete len:259 (+) Transcript_12003:357-1133(+)